MARNFITKTCSCPGYPNAHSLRIQCSRLGTDAAALTKQYFCLLGKRDIFCQLYMRNLVKFSQYFIFRYINVQNHGFKKNIITAQIGLDVTYYDMLLFTSLFHR